MDQGGVPPLPQSPVPPLPQPSVPPLPPTSVKPVPPPPASAAVHSSFFGNEGTGSRIAYVIDYSGSMLEDGREDLLRSELTRSLTSLPEKANYTVIMFMAEAWRHEKSPAHEANFSDEEDGWIPATPQNFSTSLQIIRNFSVEEANQSSLMGGTNWESGLALALAMRPKPDVVYFMTDGLTDSVPPDIAEAAQGIDGFLKEITGWSPELSKAVGETDEQMALRMGRLNAADGRRAVIHAVSMMEPKAARALGTLARENSGTFSIVSSDGMVKVVKALE